MVSAVTMQHDSAVMSILSELDNVSFHSPISGLLKITSIPRILWSTYPHEHDATKELYTIHSHQHPPVFSGLLSLFGVNPHKHQGVHDSVNSQVISSKDGKYVYILWEDDLTSTGLSDIFLKKSGNYGESFSDAINLSNTIGLSRTVKAAISGNNLYIIWADSNSTTENFKIFYKKITDNGNTLGETRKISNANICSRADRCIR